MTAAEFFLKWYWYSGVTLLNGEWVRNVSIDDTSGIVMVRIHDKQELRLFDPHEYMEAVFT